MQFRWRKVMTAAQLQFSFGHQTSNCQLIHQFQLLWWDLVLDWHHLGDFYRKEQLLKKVGFNLALHCCFLVVGTEEWISFTRRSSRIL
nr:hypothetical protein Iba_scaffold42513CG0010 [Ipomoea batatas]GMD93951.1 hypothetical protein Iba_chr14fCG12440 [Ipomoea batatas]GME18730.1 hypothetical protein Iba_scaffold21135CG0010 [Ipomoea batatas]